jgi:hypothetical protein
MAQALRCSKLSSPATRPPGRSALLEMGPGGPDFAGPFSFRRLRSAELLGLVLFRARSRRSA